MVPKGRGLKSIHHGLAVPATLALPAMATPGLPFLWNSAPAPVQQAVGSRRLAKALCTKSPPLPSTKHPVFMISISSWGKTSLLFSLEGPESHLNSISLHSVTQPSQHRALVIP